MVDETEHSGEHEEPDDLTGSTVGRFLIRERLGAGGMGEVYRADDPQLKRTVAIKRLRARGDGRANRELLKEGQRASALSHPRIASVYDVFTDGDELFLVMEFVDGRTLRQRLEGTRLAIDEFLTIATQCLDGLSAAHRRDILHGDLKPANIMLTRDGDVKICDFGLARRLPRGNSSAETSISVPRGAVGTPAYMAPEVVFEMPLDVRTDIFSLGIVFYEMLAGRNPFVADDAMATIDRVFTLTPDRLDRINPQVSRRLAALIQRMFERDPVARPASVSEIAIEFDAIRAERANEDRKRRLVRRAVVLGASAAAVALFTIGIPRFEQWRQAQPTGAPMPASVHLAVLPFTAPPGDSVREFFTEGLVDSINAKLARLTVNRPLQVATTTDLRTRSVTTPAEARDQLGANVAFVGTLRYTGNVLEVICQIVDTRTGGILRAETVTADAANPLGLEDRIVEATVMMLGLTLSASEHEAIVAHPTAQPGAYDYYLQARGYLLTYDRLENIDNAVTVFRKALDIDKRYALAYAGLGEAYWRKHELTGSATWVEPSRGACEGALALDSTLAEPHACLGLVLAGTGEYEKAAAEYALALQREPTDDVLYLGLANAYDRLGRPQDAEQAYRRAIQLRPHYWGAYNMLGAYYYRAARYDDALAMFQQVVALTPDSYRGYSSIGAIYFMKDQTADAIAAFQKSLAIRPNYNAASNLGTLYYFEGDFRRSADLFRQALAIDQGNYFVWANLAAALELLGVRDDALAAHRRTRELLRERLSVNSRDASIHVYLADSDAALGDVTAARADLDAALKLAPTEPHTLLQIAMIYEHRFGNRAAALEWLAKAIARGQTWREIDRSPTLRKLREDPAFMKLRRRVA